VEIFVTTAVLEKEDILIAFPEVGGDISFRNCRNSPRFIASDRLHPNVQSILMGTQKGDRFAGRRNLISRPFRIAEEIAKWNGRRSSMLGRLGCGTHEEYKKAAMALLLIPTGPD
jgi:hypothetical protein